jgi:hypothetical protein
MVFDHLPQRSARVTHRSGKVSLVGSWPTRVAAQLKAVLGEMATVSEVEVVAQRGMMPWADVASLVSAAAAAITIGLSLWDRRKFKRDLRSDKASDLKALDTHVKQQGIRTVF